MSNTITTRTYLGSSHAAQSYLRHITGVHAFCKTGVGGLYEISTQAVRDQAGACDIVVSMPGGFKVTEWMRVGAG